MHLQSRKMHLVLSVVAGFAVSGSGQSTLSVNVGGASTVVNKEIFGVLMERLGHCVIGGLWVGTGSSVPNINGMRTDIINGFKECGCGAIQYPGGCAAASYAWDNPPLPIDVNTDRFMQLCSLTTCTPIITGRAQSNYAATNQAWINYINNNSSHPNWALHHYQAGNEVWGCGGNYQSWNGTSPYKPHYDANYDRVKPAINGKTMYVIAGTDGIWKYEQWLRDMLADNAGRKDMIEVHDYIYYPDNIHGLNFSDAEYYNLLNLSNEGQIRPRLDGIINVLNTYDSGNRIKIWEGEWGCWLIDDGYDGWRQWGTLMEGLSAGEHLNLFIRYSHRMFGAGLAQAINVIHSLMNTQSSTGALVKTATFYVFKMYIPHHTNNARYAPITLTSERVSNVNAISAAATVDNSSFLHISLTNIDLTATRTVNLTLTNTSFDPAGVDNAQIVTGPAKNSYNPYGGAEVVNMQNFSLSNVTKTGIRTYRVTMPPRSIVMLNFRLSSALPGAFVKSYDDMFSIRAGSGSQGAVLVTSSVNRTTPVTISLYGVDGRTLVDRVSKTFTEGNSSCVLKSSRPGRGVYIVKIAGEGINLSRKIVMAR
ncbi:MAG: T9SS type A sorting domain-containing protein [Chitinispirillaceae bacterium]|nr:T9SS type A sorting domain-containing protein [Chitinispirillaceae bacterium]